MKLSIIIPTKGRTDLLKKSIQSILNQQIDQYQIIIADNNKDEKVTQFISNTIAEISLGHGVEILYLKSTANCAGGVRNDAIQKSKSDIIFFLDDDDELLSNSLLTRYNFFQRNPDADLLYCAAYTKFYNYPFSIYRYYKYKEHAVNERLNITSCSCIGVRKSRLDQMGIKFNEALSQRHDYDFCKQILEKKLKVYSIPKPLVKVHIHAMDRISSKLNDIESVSKILVEKWGDSVIKEMNKYISDVYLWRMYLGKEARSSGVISRELKSLFNIDTSFLFTTQAKLIKMSRFVYISMYHFVLYFFLKIKNNF
jgi:glycosyltransferase involved in cell wall biosynthesis